jgi:hypothetical protein
MKTVHSLAIAASLIATLSGGSSTPAVTSVTDAQNQQSAAQQLNSPISLQPKISCMDRALLERVLALSVIPQPNAPKAKCKCGECPFTVPPAICGEGFKRCKDITNCSFNITCDGVVQLCTVKIQVERCVPQNQRC